MIQPTRISDAGLRPCGARHLIDDLVDSLYDQA